MFCLYCKLDSTEQSGIKKTTDKATQSSKGQKQARTRSVAGVLYSALVYNCWCCCGVQLQILLLLVLVLLLLLLLVLVLVLVLLLLCCSGNKQRVT
jgi:RsiW-degrading membrane proteinase PrsW (M82 family)